MKNNTSSHAALPQRKTFPLLRRLTTSYVVKYRGQIALSILYMAIAGAMTGGIAQLMRPILDDVISGEQQQMIVPVAAALLAAFVIRGLTSYAAAVSMNKVSQFMIGDVQKHLFSHFMTLDLAFFHDNSSGRLMSLIVNDVNILRSTVSDVFMGLGKSLITLVFLIVVMFLQDFKLALAALTIFPLAAGFVAYLGRRIRKVSKTLQGDVASLSDKLTKVFQGIRVVKSYGREGYEAERADTAIMAVRKMNVKAVRIGQLSTPVNEVLVGIILFFIIIYGGYQAAQGQMTPGELGAFLTAFIMAYEPMKKLANLNNSIQTGLGAAERVFQALDTPRNITQSDTAQDLDARAVDITFDHVDFGYANSDVKAVDDVSFMAKSGEVTALVGASGGGKTTILNMIPRFYDAVAGQVLINGIDVRDISLDSLRAHIALVSQDITIFDASLADNIAYGKLGATQAEIELAARAASAHDFIMDMEDGYETQVGEDGLKLSGGQRQRISIARAILKDAPVLLLDEATSALDNESEKSVQAALNALAQGRTTIVIAHRLSTIQSADQILVVDQGRIVERGTHVQLMNGGVLYPAMHQAGER